MMIFDSVMNLITEVEKEALELERLLLNFFLNFALKLILLMTESSLQEENKFATLLSM